MPSDAITIIVSTGVGISVIAGVLSGMCYILAHGFNRKKIQKETLEWYCFVCGKYFQHSFFDDAIAVVCIQCGKKVCKLRCSKRTYRKKRWICYKCLKKKSWLEDAYSKYEKLLGFKKPTNSSVARKAIDSHPVEEKDHVQTFIENLVSVILGENIDDANVFRFQHPKQYDLFKKYYQDLCKAITDLSSALHEPTNEVSCVVYSPSTAHSNLKDILEDLIKDAAQMSATSNNSENSSNQREQTYEEQLAAAILNKVISKHQRTVGTTMERITEEKVNNSNDDYDSSEEDFFDDASPKYYAEELSSKIVEDKKGNIEKNNCFVNDSSNWFLQKRVFRTSNSSVPVAMVMPNPLSTSKILIGEKEIDDWSNDDETDIIIKPTENEADRTIEININDKNNLEDITVISYRGNNERRVPKKATTVQKLEKNHCKRQASLPSRTQEIPEPSIENHIHELEAEYTYSSLPRSLYIPKNSTRNFVKNPLIYFPKSCNGIVYHL